MHAGLISIFNVIFCLLGESDYVVSCVGGKGSLPDCETGSVSLVDRPGRVMSRGSTSAFRPKKERLPAAPMTGGPAYFVPCTPSPLTKAGGSSVFRRRKEVPATHPKLKARFRAATARWPDPLPPVRLPPSAFGPAGSNRCGRRWAGVLGAQGSPRVTPPLHPGLSVFSFPSSINTRYPRRQFRSFGSYQFCVRSFLHPSSRQPTLVQSHIAIDLILPSDLRNTTHRQT